MVHILTEKERKLVMVIETSKLFTHDHPLFQGFVSYIDSQFHSDGQPFDYSSFVMDNHGFMTRGRPTRFNEETGEVLQQGSFAEASPRYKQPVTYTVIVNKDLHSFYVYERARHDEGYDEARLEGLCSIGVGGHIEISDMVSAMASHPRRIFGSGDSDLLTRVAAREIDEETTADNNFISCVGYLNDESNDVSQVHFGLVYIAFTDQRIVGPRGRESANGRMMYIDELKARIGDCSIKLESWSEILLPKLEEYLNSLQH